MPSMLDAAMKGYAFADQAFRNQRTDERQKVLQGREDEAYEQKKETVADQKRINREKAIRYKLENNLQLDDNDIEHIKVNYPDFADPDKALAQLAGARKLMAMAEAGKLDHKTIVDTMNVTYASQINKGTGGQKRIANLYPTEDGSAIIPELEVINEKGEKYLAPMTKNRGTAAEGDDEVKQIPLQQIFQDVTTRGMMADAMAAHWISKGDTSVLERKQAMEDEERKFIRDLMAKGAVMDKQHGQQKELIGLQNTNQTALVDKQHQNAVDLADVNQKHALEKIIAQAEASQPEAAKMYDYLVKNGVAGSVKEAMQVVQMMKSDPQKTILDLAAKAKKAQEDSLVGPGDPEYKSDEELVQMYAQLMAEIPKALGLAGGEEQQQGTMYRAHPGLGSVAPPQQAAPQGNRPALSELL